MSVVDSSDVRQKERVKVWCLSLWEMVRSPRREDGAIDRSLVRTIWLRILGSWSMARGSPVHCVGPNSCASATTELHCYRFFRSVISLEPVTYTTGRLQEGIRFGGQKETISIVRGMSRRPRDCSFCKDIAFSSRELSWLTVRV
jgi:hypothetical protein